jgi:hypothetical protein
MKLKDKPVFPQNYELLEGQEGMTLREHYAGLAMQGLLSSAEIHRRTNDKRMQKEIAAEYAVEYADALIAELEKQEGEE